MFIRGIMRLWDELFRKVAMDKERLKSELINDEGVKYSAYQDHLGYWTIGVGHLIDSREGGALSKAAVDFILMEDIQEKSSQVFSRLPWVKDMPEPVQRALVNMAFQMGVDGLMGFTNTLSLIQARKFSEAADNALKSKWATQTPNRARRVTDLIRGAK